MLSGKNKESKLKKNLKKEGLEYKIKTELVILPEYKIYNDLFGTNYDHRLTIIKECLSKNYSISKIKNILLTI